MSLSPSRYAPILRYFSYSSLLSISPLSRYTLSAALSLVAIYGSLNYPAASTKANIILHLVPRPLRHSLTSYFGGCLDGSRFPHPLISYSLALPSPSISTSLSCSSRSSFLPRRCRLFPCPTVVFMCNYCSYWSRIGLMGLLSFGCIAITMLSLWFSSLSLCPCALSCSVLAVAAEDNLSRA